MKHSQEGFFLKVKKYVANIEWDNVLGCICDITVCVCVCLCVNVYLQERWNEKKNTSFVLIVS